MRNDPQPLAVTYLATGSLRPNQRNARTHSKKQIRQIADSIREFGFLNPILTGDDGLVLAGHGRLAAAKILGLESVPTLQAAGLTEAQKRAFVLADNRLAEKAGWDRELLAIELGELAVLLPSLDLDLTLTGFDPGEIDLLFHERDEPCSDPLDEAPPPEARAVTRPGDIWCLGAHRLICGDARSVSDLDRLMVGEKARMTFTDPPYNVPITGHVGGRGRTRHREFEFASGEMSVTAFTTFLRESFGNIARVSSDGAIVFACMDWRHITECHAAGTEVFTEWKNLVVWNKMSPGQGSFYRSQHELIFVFKAGTGAHRNSFGLGAHGRSRSNVWSHPGSNGFHAGRSEELTMHPTIKPIGLVMDALRDCSLKGDTVLDPFLGSGTTLLAAERLGRRGFGVEFDPVYVDVAIRRWQSHTRAEAALEGNGRSWDEVRSERARKKDSADDPARTGSKSNRCKAPPPEDGQPAVTARRKPSRVANANSAVRGSR